MENENKNNQLQIELKEEVAQGTYANLAIITHSTSEFIVDFVRIMPGLPKAGVQSRIVMTPEHAKRLMYALQDNVAKYEHNFGPIRDCTPAFGKPGIIRTKSTINSEVE
jgi:hypothetical protein